MGRISITFPPAGFDATTTARLQEGTLGSTYIGCWVLLAGLNRYLYFTHTQAGSARGVDPGLTESALSGLTGIEATLDAGNNTAARVAELAETAIEAVFASSVDRSGATIEFYHPDLIAADCIRGGTWLARGNGRRGRLGLRQVTLPGSDAGIGALGSMEIPIANQGTVPFRCYGYQIMTGTTVSAGLRLRTYAGGTAGAPDGSVPVANSEILATGLTGDAINQVLFPPSLGFRWDPVAENRILRIAMMGSGGTSETRFISAPSVAQSDYTTAAAKLIADGSGLTGAGTAMPATLTGAGATNNLIFCVSLLIQEEPYYGDFDFRTYLGWTPGVQTRPQNTALDNVFVGNTYDVPNMPGAHALRWSVDYGAHDAANQFWGEVWQNVTSDTNFAGETIAAVFGATSGSATGIVSIDAPTPTSFPLTHGVPCRVTVKATTGASTLNFDQGGEVALTTEPYGNYRGNTTETETDGTDVTFDFSNTPTVSPLPAPVAVDTNPDNNVGITLLVGWPGIALSALPEISGDSVQTESTETGVFTVEVSFSGDTTATASEETGAFTVEVSLSGDSVGTSSTETGVIFVDVVFSGDSVQTASVETGSASVEENVPEVPNFTPLRNSRVMFQHETRKQGAFGKPLRLQLRNLGQTLDASLLTDFEIWFARRDGQGEPVQGVGTLVPSVDDPSYNALYLWDETDLDIPGEYVADVSATLNELNEDDELVPVGPVIFSEDNNPIFVTILRTISAS